MFKLIKRADAYGGSGCVAALTYNDTQICNVITWGFASCAVYVLQGFSWEGVDAEKFFDFLTSDAVLTEGLGGWNPREMYFLLTPHLKDLYKGLIEHPCVKAVDTFTNKAHGGKRLTLYRYSKANDFSKGLK